MAWYDQLIAQGYTPPGAKQNNIAPLLDSFSRGIDTFQQGQKMQEEEKMAKQKKRIDMYKTLRDAGYAPNKAYDAVKSNALPDVPGEATIEEQRVKSDYKVAQTENLKAKTDYYQSKQPKISERILEKISDGEPLTAGEQQIYDETIKKPDSSLAGILKAPKTEPAAKVNEEPQYVPMLTPDGKKKKVHKDDVKKALKQGWKLRQ